MRVFLSLCNLRSDKVNFCRARTREIRAEIRDRRHPAPTRRPHYETAYAFLPRRSDAQANQWRMRFTMNRRGVPPHSDCRDNDFFDRNDNWRLGSAAIERISFSFVRGGGRLSLPRIDNDFCRAEGSREIFQKVTAQTYTRDATRGGEMFTK